VGDSTERAVVSKRFNGLARRNSQSLQERVDVERTVDHGTNQDAVLDDVQRRPEGRSVVAVSSGYERAF